MAPEKVKELILDLGTAGVGMSVNGTGITCGARIRPMKQKFDILGCPCSFLRMVRMCITPRHKKAWKFFDTSRALKKRNNKYEALRNAGSNFRVGRRNQRKKSLPR